MALCGGIVLEEALDLSFDRLLMMTITVIIFVQNSIILCYLYFFSKLQRSQSFFQ